MVAVAVGLIGIAFAMCAISLVVISLSGIVLGAEAFIRHYTEVHPGPR